LGRAAEQDRAVGRALERAGLPKDREFRRRYPSQISVGQAQRVLIAMAVMHSPALLITDEPTSALDVVTQREVLTMLTSLNRDLGTSVLYISHDLQSVASICHRVAILLDGEIVECGETARVLRQPRHPYTQQLLECAPWLQPRPQWKGEGASQELLRRAEAEWEYLPSTPGEMALGLKSIVPPPIAP
jgi:ABC-type dipeptide/oligopeptide/nickel transport system ATPase component